MTNGGAEIIKDELGRPTVKENVWGGHLNNPQCIKMPRAILATQSNQKHMEIDF